MSYVGFKNMNALILIIVLVASQTYEQNYPTGNNLQKRQPTETCASPDEPRCRAPKGVTPIVKTFTQNEIETITLHPKVNDNANKNNNNQITRWKTTITTATLYFAGYTSTITTTDSAGKHTTFVTYIPPFTVLVVKKVAVTAADEEVTDSTTTLHDLNSHSLWGITIGLAVVIATLVIMVFA